MKTKELIEILKKADPSGECHVRMSGGIPKYAYTLPGYYDGSYQYIDEDNNFVTSTMGTKVDLYTIDIWDYVSDLIDDGEDWESIKSKFKFDMGNMLSNDNNKKYRIDPVLKRAKDASDEIIGIKDKVYNRGFEEMKLNADKGWQWFQNKKVDTEGGNHHHYTWLIFDENDKKQPSNVHNTESIKKSGLWEKVDNGVREGYYQWIFKVKQ